MMELDETASLLTASTQSVSSYGGISVSKSVSNATVLEAVDPVVLSWKNLRVSVSKSGRELLQGVSGVAAPGQLLALMGASGAGKTTLLNTFLCRNLKGLKVDGRVEVNGNCIGRDITAISGYAQQEEMFVGALTVREYLCIQARLRTNLSKEKRERRVNIIITQLGLRKCQNNKIGIVGVLKGISGGEARRLTFACELLSNPALLFCDEPTTGLDSFMAEHVVMILSKLAKSGRTIVCTIHQPASQLYLMFDKVMFLASGRTAFFGSPREGIGFFEKCGYPCPRNYNPADLIIHTLAVVPHEEDVCRTRITSICDKFEAGEYGKILNEELANVKCTEVPPGRRRVNIGVQVAALLHRYSLDNLRNPSLARAKLMQKFVMGIFVGLLYFQTPLSLVGIGNLNGALFYLVGELTYSTLFGILTCLPSDYPLVAKEYHDGIYYVFSYYLARVLSYLPLFSIDGLLMIYVCYWMVGFSSSLTQVLFATLISFLIEQSSSAFGVMLAFYISWIQYLSWFRYGFEALAINQWNEVGGPNATTWTTERRDEILAQYSFTADRFVLDQVLMVVFMLVFYLIGYIGLSVRIYRSR
ncbi:hypothetical protein Q1695_006387 [Nippostrongylus brasiliensis]|nr:hypothetical protein Q1695_006387 [Nippostrongylus brasiliensis]